MEAPKNPFPGLGLVVLYEIIMKAELLEVAFVVGLHEIAAIVPEYLGLEDDEAVYVGLGKGKHCSYSFPSFE